MAKEVGFQTLTSGPFKGLEVFDKNFSNVAQAERFAKKHGGKVLRKEFNPYRSFYVIPDLHYLQPDPLPTGEVARGVKRMKWRSSKPGIASKGRRDRRRHMIEAIKSAEWSDKNAITGNHPAVGSFYDHMNQVRGKDRTQVKKELKKKGLLKSGFVASYFR